MMSNKNFVILTTLASYICTDGNLAAVEMWHQKTLAAYENIDLPSSKNFKEEVIEIFLSLCTAYTLFVMLDRCQISCTLLSTIGFTWSPEGFENLDTTVAEMAIMQPMYDHWCPIYFRLLIFLSSPDGAIDEAEVNAWIPSPAELAELERGHMTGRRFLIRTCCVVT